MATNPNYRPPEPRGDRRNEPQIVEQIEKPSRVPWPLIALVVAGVILAAIIIALPRTPKAAPGPSAGEVPDQPFGSQLQVKGVRLSSAPVGGQVYLYGEIENTGSNPVGQVTVDAAFNDAQGQPVQRETRNLEFLKDNKGAPEVVTTPLKPRQSVPFRVGFDALPTSWNHQVPQMRIVHVAAPGQPGIPAGDTSGTGTAGISGAQGAAGQGGSNAQGAAAGQGQSGSPASGSGSGSGSSSVKPPSNPPR